VADVTIDGLPQQEVRVEIDTQKMQQYGISWSQVMAAVKTENEKIPLGDFEVKNRTYALKLAEPRYAESLNQVIVSRSKEGFPVYLKDIGKVSLTTEKTDYYVTHNGKPAVSLSINAELGSDVPTLQRKVDKMMQVLEKSLPSWAQKEVVYSQNEHSFARSPLCRMILELNAMPWIFKLIKR
jgi:multidrug efflux pump subunit AcrB